MTGAHGESPAEDWSTHRPFESKSWILAYLAIVLAWGLTFLFTSWTLVTFTPIGVSLGSSVLGATTLLLVCLVTRTRLPPLALWPRLVVYSLLVASVPWVLLGVAVTHVATSIVAVLGSMTAIWVFVLNLLFFPEQRASPTRVAGIFLGFAGILVVIGVWNGVGSGTVVGIGAQLLAVLLYAFSLPYSHRFLTGGKANVSTSPIALSAVTFFLATLEVLPFSIVLGGTHAPLVPSALIGMIAVGTLSSGVVAVLVLYVVKQTDSTTASSITYFVPLVAIAAGVALLGEVLAWYQVLGAVVVVIGAGLAQGVLGPRAKKHIV